MSDVPLDISKEKTRWCNVCVMLSRAVKLTSKIKTTTTVTLAQAEEGGHLLVIGNCTLEIIEVQPGRCDTGRVRNVCT